MRNRRRGYKFTNKSHAKKGLWSSGIGFFALLFLIGLFYVAYRMSGNAGAYTGFLGFLSMLAVAVGLILGLQSLKEEDCYYVFSYIGCVLNGVLLVIWMMVYIAGM